jgi:hypothetical protein
LAYVETGVRLETMSELTEGIPRRLFIGPYPIETRYRGQVPLCGRCGEYGHRVATCSNDVKCFKCGQNGHIQRHHPTEQETVQTVENNKRKAEEDVSIPEEGVPVPEDPTDQRVSDMGGSPEEKTEKTDNGKKKKWKK